MPSVKNWCLLFFLGEKVVFRKNETVLQSVVRDARHLLRKAKGELECKSNLAMSVMC